MYTVVEENLRTAMRCYASVGQGSETRDYPGVTISSSGLNVAVFNSAMLTLPTNDLQPLVRTAGTHFLARQLGWTFWVCDDMLASDQRGWAMRDAFRTARMTAIGEPPGMYADRLSPYTGPVTPLSFVRVGDESTRLEFAHIASAVFALPFLTSKRIYASAGLWRQHNRGWIGYLGRKPVSIVTTVMGSDAIGVYSLGTLPQHQRCGYGEAILRHAVEEARRETGIERSVLQATPQGLRLYQRLGYRVVTKFSIFMQEGCAAF